jgi:hypothetical protein
LGIASAVAVTVTVNTWTEDPSLGSFIFPLSIMSGIFLCILEESLSWHHCFFETIDIENYSAHFHLVETFSL